MEEVGFGTLKAGVITGGTLTAPVPQAEREGDVPGQLAVLHGAIENLDATVSMLIEKLQPVTSQEAKEIQATGRAVEVARSPIGERIQKTAERVYEAGDRLRNLLGEIEL